MFAYWSFFLGKELIRAGILTDVIFTSARLNPPIVWPAESIDMHLASCFIRSLYFPVLQFVLQAFITPLFIGQVRIEPRN